FSTTPNTEALVKKFLSDLKKLDNLEFAFLLVHSGFIPEQYPADSSPETLYSKLVESLVLEFAVRMGYSNSYLPTQKASMEDVTFIDKNNTVIVCDSKSFRLGRSPGAPNVKDVLKHADIKKWMDNHSDKNPIGGLVTMPSQHDWAKGSDFYSYTSDKDLPTICLYYEHLAFLLINKHSSEELNLLLKNYGEVFPKKLKDKKNNRRGYYTALESNLFKGNEEKWITFNAIAQIVIQEKVFHCVDMLEKRIEATR
uniref:HindIII family type II restriction endonuclease n=1 Tax=Vibrio anguillarum TaxID=55601 RepID=UPI00188A8334